MAYYLPQFAQPLNLSNGNRCSVDVNASKNVDDLVLNGWLYRREVELVYRERVCSSASNQ